MRASRPVFREKTVHKLGLDKIGYRYEVREERESYRIPVSQIQIQNSPGYSVAKSKFTNCQTHRIQLQNNKCTILFNVELIANQLPNISNAKLPNIPNAKYRNCQMNEWIQCLNGFANLYFKVQFPIELPSHRIHIHILQTKFYRFKSWPLPWRNTVWKLPISRWKWDTEFEIRMCQYLYFWAFPMMREIRQKWEHLASNQNKKVRVKFQHDISHSAQAGGKQYF
jgi:hypothetical protein